jgi:phage terminase small subunit
MDEPFRRASGASIPRLPPKEEEALTEGLTEKQKLFSEIYVQNFNATQAAIKAGYPVESARYIGYENLTKPHIRSYVEALKELKRAALLLSEDDIVERYMRIAFADITDFLDFGRTTVPVMAMYGPLTVKNPNTGEDVVVTKDVNDVRFKESWMVDGGIVSQVKMGKDGASIKLEDRMKALEWLSAHFIMNPMDKHKVEYENKRLILEQQKAAYGVPEDNGTGVIILPERDDSPEPDGGDQ